MRAGTGKRMLVILCCGLLVAAVGCARKTVYVQPGEVPEMGPELSDTDIREMAAAMYESLLPRVVGMRAPDAPPAVVALLDIKNKTSEHIDTDMVADKLQVELLRAGTLRFVDRTLIGEMSSEFELAESGFIDPAKAKSAGKALGADYFLYGEVGSIKKTDGGKRLNYYRLSMKLADVETNEVLWAEEFETRKLETRPGLGW
jgi:uncharacterized protein (TIGR02722 family)